MRVIGSDGKKAGEGFICLKHGTGIDFEVHVASLRNPGSRGSAGGVLGSSRKGGMERCWCRSATAEFGDDSDRKSVV